MGRSVKTTFWGWVLLVVVILLGLLAVVQLNKAPIHTAPQATPSPTPTAKSVTISGIVVPHHDLVREKRAELFADIKNKVDPGTVILISPNHYSSGRVVVQTTTRTWQLDKGQTISPNQAVIEALLAGKVEESDSSFDNEHGIKNILGDIKETFPKADIVPLLFKEGWTNDQLKDLTDTLHAMCEKCLVIASVDFSHYQPALLANLHDNLTRGLLVAGDNEGVLKKAEVDCPSCLNVLMQWGKLKDTPLFHDYAHTNSGELLKDPDVETTTHIFGWYESGEPREPTARVSFLLGGDAMFGRMVAHRYLSKGLETVFDQLGNRVFWGTDAGIINLEGPVSDVSVPDDIRPNNLVFNFPPESIDALEFLKVNAVSLANNHSANAGSKGLATTRELLTKAGISPIGAPSGVDKATVSSFKGRDLTLYVIGVHTLTSIPDLGPVIKELKADPKARVLVFPHWGNEYQYMTHAKGQENQAHAWIDAGADVVIGAHPHVIQDSELYKGKPIFYSMGNFVFDQDFSKETNQGLLVAGEFTEKGLDLFTLPVQIKESKPQLMRGSGKNKLLDALYAPFSQYKVTDAAGTLLSIPLR